MITRGFNGVEYWASDHGVTLIGKGASLLKDEVLGKLLAKVLALYPTIEVAEVDASSHGDGGLKITFTTYITADELNTLPSVYDEPAPTPKKRKRAKRGKK